MPIERINRVRNFCLAAASIIIMTAGLFIFLTAYAEWRLEDPSGYWSGKPPVQEKQVDCRHD